MKIFNKIFGSETYDSDPYKFKIGDRVKILIYMDQVPQKIYIGEVVDRSYYPNDQLDKLIHFFGIQRNEEYEVVFEGARGGEVRHWYLAKELEHYDARVVRQHKIEKILS